MRIVVRRFAYEAEERMKIKEVIVVEGKCDSERVKMAVSADTLETNGFELSHTTLERIKLAHKKRGIIIFTDPDFPGERIRKLVSNSVKGAKHAFLPQDEAKNKNGGIGIEHASLASIRKALATVKEEMETEPELISWQTLIQLGLIGGGNARKRREQLGRALNIGYMNGKQLYKRLRMFQVSQHELQRALNKDGRKCTNAE